MCYPYFEGDYVWIVWEPFEDLDRRGILHFNERENWDAEIAYSWLINSFIPKVLTNKRKMKFSIYDFIYDKTYYKDRVFTDIYTNDHITYLTLEGVKTNKMLYELVARLQVFYNRYPHLRFRLIRSELQGIYDSILISISKSKKADLQYISGKLRVIKVNSIIELIYNIEEIKNNIKECNMNGFDIDLLMRVLLAAMNDGNCYLIENEINDILVKLKPIVEVYNRQVLFDKYLI